MMLKAYGLTTSAETLTESEFLKKLAGFYYGPDFADEAAEIWHEFGNILEGFPCDNNVFYYGPLPRCPGYQLHLTGNSQLPLYNYNWGLDRSRNLQPYYCSADKRWAGQFEPAELIKVFRQLGSAWDKACKRLAAIPATTAETKRQAAVAEALGIIMQSAANIYEFYLLREHCKEPQMAGRLCEIARQEIRLVNRMEQLLAMDCRIGFHSEIYYYVLSPQLLRDKTANCEKIIRTLETNNLYKVKEGEYVNSM
jgi:hypothetical protein